MGWEVACIHSRGEHKCLHKPVRLSVPAVCPGRTGQMSGGSPSGRGDVLYVRTREAGDTGCIQKSATDFLWVSTSQLFLVPESPPLLGSVPCCFSPPVVQTNRPENTTHCNITATLLLPSPSWLRYVLISVTSLTCVNTEMRLSLKSPLLKMYWPS